MESSIFFGGSVVAAFVAGAIALFAPCCISVMLPAYFATSFQNRATLVAMTFVFAAGVATMILPLVLGISLLRGLVLGQHAVVYVTGGLLMLGLGIYTLAGGKLQLPTPGQRAGKRTGLLGIYSLGLFSGIASSCCAPVLAGVIALSSIVPNLGIALGLGAAYVFGMVGPLFLIALLWERYNWRSLLNFGNVTWRVGRLRRTIPAAMLASGVLLILIGAGTIWIGLTTDAMAPPGDWAALLTLRLQEAGRAVAEPLAWMPNWLAAAVLIVAVALLARHAISQIGVGAARRNRAPLSLQQNAERGSRK